jgi:hypothetical protein
VNNLKQTLKKITFVKLLEIIFVVALTFAPLAVSYAALPNLNCNELNGLNCSTNTASGMIKLVINWMLGLAGLISVLFLIIGGFWYITSAGNEETAEKGKGTAINAIIGIVIIIMSWVIVNVVSNLVSKQDANGI